MAALCLKWRGTVILEQWVVEHDFMIMLSFSELLSLPFRCVVFKLREQFRVLMKRIFYSRYVVGARV
jgi:hypothetical protein